MVATTTPTTITTTYIHTYYLDVMNRVVVAPVIRISSRNIKVLLKDDRRPNSYDADTFKGYAHNQTNQTYTIY